MKAVINGFLTAFAMYSRIPMPRTEWSRQNRKYTLCFFPMVGAVIGALLYGWNRVCAALGIGQGCFALAGTAVPLLVTGGIHLDGLLDTADALHSYAKKEKKLEILKDPHVGAFGVITAIGFNLLYVAGLLLITEKYQLLLLAFGFVLSRLLSGIEFKSLAYDIHLMLIKHTLDLILNCKRENLNIGHFHAILFKLVKIRRKRLNLNDITRHTAEGIYNDVMIVIAKFSDRHFLNFLLNNGTCPVS